MVLEKSFWMDGREYTVTVSDETKALLAADAAGRAVVGVINSGIPDQSLEPCRYVVTDPEDADTEFLIRVQRRRLGLPWIIAETDRLVIREFTDRDPLCPEPVAGDRCQVFLDRELRQVYIRNQYAFFGYGIWALEEKRSGRIVGKAGFEEQSLGYHIYPEFRGRGYGREACEAVIAYAKKELEVPALYIETDASNEASVHMAKCLGFSVCRGARESLSETEASGGRILFEKIL